MASLNEKRVKLLNMFKENATAKMSVNGAQKSLQNAFGHGHGHGHGHGYEYNYGYGYGHRNGIRQLHSRHQLFQKNKLEHIGRLSHKISSKPYHHAHNNHASQYAKESPRGGMMGNNNNRKLEIFDFHESWLEEMQMYRDIMQRKKHIYPSQLLNMRNQIGKYRGYDNGHTLVRKISQITDGKLTTFSGLSPRSVDNKVKVTTPSHNTKQRKRANSESLKYDKNYRSQQYNNQSQVKHHRDHSCNAANKRTGHRAIQSSKSPHARRSSRKKDNQHNHNHTNVNININLSNTNMNSNMSKIPNDYNNDINNNNSHSIVNANANTNANANANTNANTNANANAYATSNIFVNAKASAANTTTAVMNNNNNNSNNNGNNSRPHYNHYPHLYQSILSNNSSYYKYQNSQSSNINSQSKVSNLTNKGKMKIIVNQFHASSLLNGHEFEEKAKILTRNGLTNSSAATAYEASFYAANYLSSHPNNSNGKANMSIIPRSRTDATTNFIGVSLAKYNSGSNNSNTNSSNSTNNNSYRHHYGNIDDDPCAAIDDLATYTDTDSEEEYIGEPFFLDDDEKQNSLQSKNIRNQTSQESLLTNDTLNTQTSIYYRPNEILTPSLFPNVPPYLNFSSHAEKGPQMPAQLHKVLKWKLSPIMPKIVKRVVLNSGFRIIKNTTDWMAIWEKHMKSPGFRTIRSHQKYNHMPGSFRIGRKDAMWRNIQQNTQKYGNKEFGFMQKSYVLPDDLEDLRLAWPKNAAKSTKWIVKPPASARGTGIRIINQWSQFPKDRPLVIQKYIERPLLVNDNKFDMRMYVVLTSVNPLRLYLYKDGLARFASVKYSSELNSLDERCMHLTNYSINKFSQNYSKNEDFNACQGHKWTLQSLWSCLEARGVNTKRLWATLRNLVIKAIISGEGGLNRMYRQNVNFRYNCFEMFGFDILLDENLIPWLLEINISPSLHSELPLDLHVKGPLIQAVLNTALYQVPPKLSEKAQQDILNELKLNGPLCHDKRIFTTCLTADEVNKHNQFTNRSVEFREEYLDTILENLLPDDVRCLIISEDEFARCKPLERIFPTSKTYTYLKFIENPRYYNRLLDAWENRYGNCREKGHELLAKLCQENYHLNVSDGALDNEPKVDVTEIDMMHIKKLDDSLFINATGTGIVTTMNPSSDSDSQASNCDIQKM